MEKVINDAYSHFSDKFGRKCRKLWRNNADRKKLTNRNFTIFSQNCIGGIMYHDLGMQFNSPTVNLLFTPSDFIKFMKNIHWYLKQEIIFLSTDTPYPIGKLGGVKIRFLHYSSNEEARCAWNKRRERINWNNVFVICCDEGLSHEDMYEFDNLPYKNKILFVSKEYPEVKSSIICKHFPDHTDARLLNFSNPFGKRFYQNYIDYVKWLNKECDYKL